MFEAGKEYKTKSGERVRIYATDAGGCYPIHGATKYQDDDNGWQLASFTASGQALVGIPSTYDLIPPRREVFGIFKKGSLFCTRNTLQEAEAFIEKYDCFEIVKFVEATDAN